VRGVHLATLATAAALLTCAIVVVQKPAPTAARETGPGEEWSGDQPDTGRQPELLLLDWRCVREGGTISVQGEVENVGEAILSNIVAIGIFQATNKDFIRSDRALLRAGPLFPGDRSSFRTSSPDDPAIAMCALDFGYLLGGSIAFQERIDESDAAYLGPEHLRELQGRLKALGYNVGLPDGIMGPRTERAIIAFQADHGLEPDGIPRSSLLAAVRSRGP
jgi:hypothetical protein